MTRRRRRRTAPIIKSITLYEDDDVMVLNKPMGLAVQGGSGTHAPSRRHARRVARVRIPTRSVRASCTGSTRTPPAACWSPRRALPPRRSPRPSARVRRARSTGRWSPACRSPQQGRISTYLAKQEVEEDSFMRIAQARREGRHARGHLLRGGGDLGAEARLDFAQAGDRPHPPIARAHGACRHIRSSAIRNISTSRTGNCPAASRSGCICWRGGSSVPHPRGGTIDVSAPLPPHMQQSWNLLGFDADALRPDRRGAGGVARRLSRTYVMSHAASFSSRRSCFALLRRRWWHAQSGKNPNWVIMTPEPGRPQEVPEPWLPNEIQVAARHAPARQASAHAP